MVKLFSSENTRRWQRGDHEVLLLVKIQCSLKQPLWSAEGKVDKNRDKCGFFCLPDTSKLGLGQGADDAQH